MCYYENMRRVTYGDENDSVGIAQFVPVCQQCGRFVKADDQIAVNEITGLKDQSNGTCKKHGRIKMLFEGFF